MSGDRPALGPSWPLCGKALNRAFQAFKPRLAVVNLALLLGEAGITLGEGVVHAGHAAVFVSEDDLEKNLLHVLGDEADTVLATRTTIPR